jgi:hypothetical protein
MTVTVTKIEGIDTERAKIRATHTPDDARAFCVEYSNDR